MKTLRFKSHGFSLIEVMVVVVIISMLAGVAAVAVNSRIQQGKVAKAQEEVTAFETALELYEQDHGSFPENLDKLFAKQKDAPEPYVKGDKKNKLTDPWGNKYKYTISRGIYRVESYGKDGKKGGEGYDADIWKTNEPSEKE